MTNREKLLEVFPYIESVGTVLIHKNTEQYLGSVNFNWLSAEYEEPTTKKCQAEKRPIIIDWNQCHTEEQLKQYECNAEDCISRSNIIDRCKYVIEHGKPSNGKHSISVETLLAVLQTMPSVMPIRPKALEQEPYKDCISREAVLNLFNKSDDYRWETTLIKKKIEKIPPVTPQEPRIDFEGLKRKILMEVDGGIDDAWLAYGEVCIRISNSIDEFVADMRGEEE